MGDDEKHIDYILIGKYLSGNASRKEIHLVETWSNSSKENQAEYKRLRQLWEEADTLISTTQLYGQNPFVKGLQTLFEDKIVTMLIERYYIGTISNKVVFWQIDQFSRIRTGKIMEYNPTTIKRTGDPNWAHKYFKLLI